MDPDPASPSCVSMMNRRSLLAGVGAVLVARPSAAGAQPPTRTARIGILSAGSLSDSPSVGAFLGQLRDVGWVDGQNLVVEYRWSERHDRLAALAIELVRLKVDIFVTPGLPATKTAHGATSSVPIVMIASTDPVADGLITSLARPGGNLTGMSVAEPQLYAGKRLELLKETVSGLSRVTVLWDASVSAPPAHLISATDSAARSLGLQLQHREVRGVADFEPAFRAAATQVRGPSCSWSPRCRPALGHSWQSWGSGPGCQS